MDNDCDKSITVKTSSNDEAFHSCIQEKFSFRWEQKIPDYGNKMLKRLNEFRKKGKLCDVTIQTKDAVLKAHKVVLAACGGIFRSFSDENLMSQNAKLLLACPADGLQSILDFAYTGNLKITFQTLLPVFLAAISTEIKEIQEVCSELCMTRLGWFLDFDGTKETLPPRNESSKSNLSEGITLTLEEAMEMLHYLLLVCCKTFKASKDMDNKETSINEGFYPCANAVEKHWPDLKPIYIELIDCLCKVKALEKLKNKKLEENEKSNSKVDLEIKAKSKDVEENKTNSGGNENFKVNTEVHSGENVFLSKAASKQQSEISVANEKRSSENLAKLSPSIAAVKCDKIDTACKPEQKRHSKSAPLIPSNRSISPISRGKHPTKPASPVLPPPPSHKSVAKSLSKSESSSKSNKVKDEKPFTKSSSKLPPPRPKPPCIQNKKKNENGSNGYDKALNPFLSE